MKILESTIILLYMVLVVGIGYYYYRKATGSEEDYWMAGRQMGVFTSSFALFAAVASASSMVGGVGLGWKLGLPFYLAYGLGAASLFPFALFLFAAQMRRTGATTLPEFFLKRYGSSVSLISSLLVILFMTLYIIPQLSASGILGSYVLGLPYKTVVVIVALTFVAYSSLGGMWAVTITSLIQGILMMTASVVIGSVIYFSTKGGFTELAKAALAANPDFGSVNLPWMSYFGIFFVFIWFAIVAPNSNMRNLAARNAAVARKAMAWGTAFFIVLWMGGLLVLVAGAGLYKPGSLPTADYVFFETVGHFLPPIMAGLVYAAIFASIMSSTDSFLLAVSAGIAHDIYPKFINKNATEKQIVRLGVFAMWIAGLVAMVLALNPPQLITIMVTWVSGGLVAAFAFPIILGIWWTRATKEGALASMVISVAVYITLVLTKPFPLVSEVLITAPLSLIIMIIVSLMTPAPSADIVESVRAQHRALVE